MQGGRDVPLRLVKSAGPWAEQAAGLVTDFEVVAHLVMGEWVVLARGRVHHGDGSSAWYDLARLQSDTLHGPDDDPHGVLEELLEALLHA